jgi:RimJ/RimL family protein N-acetyltransferase
MDTAIIHTARLGLVPLTAEALEAIVAGRHAEAGRLGGFTVPARWPGDDARFFEMRLGQVRDDPGRLPWSIRAIVLRDGNEAVGHAGFHGPPGVNGLEDPEAVEIGYTVEPERRRRGYAEETAAGLIAWAATRPGVRRVIASIAPDNEPSLGLARKLGFVEHSRVMDEEDGEEIVFVLELG